MAQAREGRRRTVGYGSPKLSVPDPPVDPQVTTLGLPADDEARTLLQGALRDARPVIRRFDWRVGSVCELPPEDNDVGYTAEDGTLFVKLRDPAKPSGQFYSYSYILATLLHELSHLSVLGHGKAFYQQLVEAVAACGAEPAVRREVHAHVSAELLNAVCDNDARRARGLLAVLPSAVQCQSPLAGNQLPLEYAAHHGRVALTRLLLDARADADATLRENGVPPLVLAASRGNCRTAKVLLEAGAMRGRASLSQFPGLASPSGTKHQAQDFIATALVAQPGRDNIGVSGVAQQQRRKANVYPHAAKEVLQRRADSVPALLHQHTTPKAQVLHDRPLAAAGTAKVRGASAHGSKPRPRPAILSGSFAI